MTTKNIYLIDFFGFVNCTKKKRKSNHQLKNTGSLNGQIIISANLTDIMENIKITK